MQGKKRKPGRPKAVRLPHIYEAEGGRLYGDFRAYADVGGGREALKPGGRGWATVDPVVAQALFETRLEELRAARRQRAGAAAPAGTRRIGLQRLAALHLTRKAEAGAAERQLLNLERYFAEAVAHFGADRDPGTITPADVQGWLAALATKPNGRGRTLSPATVRKFMWALSGLFRRAQEGGYVVPGYNPVSALVEKPQAPDAGEAAFFEVPTVALILAAAAVEERLAQGRPGGSPTPNLHAIVAAFALTGGRKSEVLGLDVEDVSFDRHKVVFRPNAHRGLKTRTSRREVPLWPQLEEVLRAHVFGGDSPRVGLLFPGRSGGMVGDLQKSLDAVAARAGVEALGTRMLRHSYCAARLQTVSRIVRPGADVATDPNPYEWVPVSRFTVQRELGHGSAALVDQVYGHVGEAPHRSETVEYRVEQHREALGERLHALEVART
jgi:integrase